MVKKQTKKKPVKLFQQLLLSTYGLFKCSAFFINFSAKKKKKNLKPCFHKNFSEYARMRHCPAKCALKTKDSAEETGISVNWGK